MFLLLYTTHFYHLPTFIRLSFYFGTCRILKIHSRMSVTCVANIFSWSVISHLGCSWHLWSCRSFTFWVSVSVCILNMWVLLKKSFSSLKVIEMFTFFLKVLNSSFILSVFNLPEIHFVKRDRLVAYFNFHMESQLFQPQIIFLPHQLVRAPLLFTKFL